MPKRRDPNRYDPNETKPCAVCGKPIFRGRRMPGAWKLATYCGEPCKTEAAKRRDLFGTGWPGERERTNDKPLLPDAMIRAAFEQAGRFEDAPVAEEGRRLHLPPPTFAFRR